MTAQPAPDLSGPAAHGSMSVTAGVSCNVKAPEPNRTGKSKSRAAKRDRVPYTPKEVLLPDPGDYFTTARYIYQQAEMGAFAGAPGQTVAVLQLLWFNTVRTDDLASNPHEAIGQVLSGKSSYAKLAAELGCSRSVVERAVRWLNGNGWLDQKVTPDVRTVGGKRMHLWPLMSLEGHAARESSHVSAGQPTSRQIDVTLPSNRRDPTVYLTPPSRQIAATVQGSYEGIPEGSSSGAGHSPGDDELLSSALEDRGGDPHTPPDSDEDEGDLVDDEDKMIIAQSLGVPVAAVGSGFWDWFAGEYDRARDGGKEEGRVFYRAQSLAAEAAVGGRNPVGMFRIIFPQKVAHVRHKFADESWARSDDAVVYSMWIRIFREDFLPKATTFTVEDVSSQLNVRPELAARALDYLVRGATFDGWLTREDGQYTRHWFDAEEAAEKAEAFEAAAKERAKREAAAAAEKAAEKAEREAAKTELDRLLPELVALVEAHDSPAYPLAALNNVKRAGDDPRVQLRALRKQIAWYRDALAERDKRDQADQAELDRVMCDFIQRIWDGDEAEARQAVNRHSPSVRERLSYVQRWLETAQKREWVLNSERNRKREDYRAVLEYIRQHSDSGIDEIAAGVGMPNGEVGTSISMLGKAKLVMVGPRNCGYRVYEEKTNE